MRKRAVSVKYEKDDLPQVNPQLYKWLSIVNGKSSTIIIPDSDEKSNTFLEKSAESTEKSQSAPLTDEERLVYELYQSELGARMSEYTLGSEEFIDRIVRTDAGLAEKLARGIKSLIGSLKRAGNPEARAEFKQLKKAEKLFLEAARAAGNTQLVNQILAYDENEDESLDDNGETRYNRRAEQYTDEEYNSFGWARANKVISATENSDLRSKFAAAVTGLAKPPKSKSGEYMIAVGEYVENKIAYMKGTIDNPVITRILEIDIQDETKLDKYRRNIYDSERRGIQQEAGELFGLYRKTDFGAYEKEGDGGEVSRHNKRIGIYGNGSGRKASRIKEIIFGEDGEVIRETRYSRKTGSSEINLNKAIAERENLRVYEKEDADKLITDVLSNISNSRDDVSINATSRKQAISLLTNAFNKSTTGLERERAAENVAEYLINHSVVRDMVNDFEAEVKRDAYAPNLAELRGWLRRLDLSRIKDEIKHRYGGDAKGVFSRWSSKNGVGADVAAMELNGLGINIEGDIDKNILPCYNDKNNIQKRKVNLYERKRAL